MQHQFVKIEFRPVKTETPHSLAILVFLLVCLEVVSAVGVGVFHAAEQQRAKDRRGEEQAEEHWN